MTKINVNLATVADNCLLIRPAINSEMRVIAKSPMKRKINSNLVVNRLELLSIIVMIILLGNSSA